MVKKPQQAQQLGLIPIRAVWCLPSNLGSADLKLFCKCDDGSEYAIKETERSQTTPSKVLAWTAHNEYFCYRLAHMVGITSPGHHLVEMPDGQVAFGSRWEGGTQPDEWWSKIASGTIKPNDILPTLANIYAFDMFVHNVDRHAGNLLIRQQQFGHAAIAFDYSRSWTYHGFPLPDLPMPHTENTVLLQRQLAHIFGQYVTEQSTSQVLNKISSITPRQIKDIMQQQHDSWLTKSLRQAIIRWWSSTNRDARIDAIRAGIKDGTLL
jgi:hypothetical protein